MLKSDLEVAWGKATQNERQAFVELFCDDLREMFPAYDDRDKPDELIAYEQDVGDDEQLDPAELPAVLDTSIECSVSDDDDGGFPAANDEEFHAAARGNRRYAGGKPHQAMPESQAEIERLT